MASLPRRIQNIGRTQQVKAETGLRAWGLGYQRLLGGWGSGGTPLRHLDFSYCGQQGRIALSDQGDPSPCTRPGAYCLKDRDSSPQVWYWVHPVLTA